MSNREATDRGNELITRPFREACSLILYTFAVAIFSVIVRVIFRKLLGRNDVLYSDGFNGFNGFIITAVGTVITVSILAFVYAYLGSVLGRRRAGKWVKGAIAAIALIGLSIVAGITLFSS